MPALLLALIQAPAVSGELAAVRTEADWYSEAAGPKAASQTMPAATTRASRGYARATALQPTAISGRDQDGAAARAVVELGRCDAEADQTAGAEEQQGRATQRSAAPESSSRMLT